LFLGTGEVSRDGAGLFALGPPTPDEGDDPFFSPAKARSAAAAEIAASSGEIELNGRGCGRGEPLVYLTVLSSFKATLLEYWAQGTSISILPVF